MRDEISCAWFDQHMIIYDDGSVYYQPPGVYRAWRVGTWIDAGWTVILP
jgi:hypothetical protein